ncbi:MAG: hypothetical protein E7262_09100 [Lachnospiraceae bacterium]|nr:hypothetical protein [Lachnospiraceae bacterium]
MNLRIKGLCVFVMAMIILTFCACNNTSQTSSTIKANNKFKQIDKDAIVVCADSYDLFFPKEGGITERRLRLPIIAGKNVKKEDIKVIIEHVDFEYDISKQKNDELEYYTYLSYTDVDWNKFTDLYKNDIIEFKKYEQTYTEEFEKINQKSYLSIIIIWQHYILMMKLKMKKLLIYKLHVMEKNII